MTFVVLAHMAATWAMVGFICTIQILQYPLMEVSQDVAAALR